MVDVLIGLSVALSRTGHITREQIAAAMKEVIEQQRTQNPVPARTYTAELMAEIFSAEVVTDPHKRFGAVDGGKVDDPPKV